MNKNAKVALSIFAIISVVAIAFAVYFYSTTSKYKMDKKYNTDRAFAEFTTSMSKVDTAISKVQYATTPEYTVSMLSEIVSESKNAKANLAQLPIQDMGLSTTSEFVSKIGDYSLSLLRKVSNGESFSSEDLNNIKMFENNSDQLMSDIQNLQSMYHNGEIDEFAMKITTFDGQEVMNVQPVFSENETADIDEKTQDFATLVYDGPFSSHIDKIKPAYLENKKVITKEEATQKVADFLQLDSKNISFIGEVAGQIPVYKFSAKKDNKEISIDLTKQGGYILNTLIFKEAGESKLTPEQAVASAEKVLVSSGFKNFEKTYYIEKDGVVTINFAFSQNDIVAYSDLIKVSIYLDDGSIAGVEARGFIMSHRERGEMKPKITMAKARQNISNNLEIFSEGLAIIPTDSKDEVLTYEFKCKAPDDKNYIVYINAYTGAIENMLILIESDNGTLTM